MAEIAVLAEKGGVSRADFFAFLNDSVMGSMFTRYKTPAYVNLDFKPTFTPALLLKDFRARPPRRRATSTSRSRSPPPPQQVVQALYGSGYHDIDFAALIEQQATRLGPRHPPPRTPPVTDGLQKPGPNFFFAS